MQDSLTRIKTSDGTTEMSLCARLCLRQLLYAVLMLGACYCNCHGQTNVLTYHNDNARTGQNPTETILTPSAVKSSFGKLFTVPMDGKVDAQPLYVSAVAVPGQGFRNVVYSATEHDTVYAFDADNGAIWWQLSLLNPGESPSDRRGCGQVEPEIGITATPVIDLKAGSHGTMYVLAMSKDAAGNYYHRLHALDIATGAEEFGGPVNIAAAYPGSGDNSSGGNVIFDAKQYKTRPGLLLLNGTVYTGWGSHCDIRPYTGWIMGYDELTLQQSTVFNFAPNGSEAALWAAGGGIAADTNGNVFVEVANGTFDTTLNPAGFPSKGDYGNAFVKFVLPGGQLQPADYWTMDDTVIESSRDEDLGSGGLILLPDLVDPSGRVRHLGTGAGKDGNVYVFDRDNMGKFDSIENSTLYQELPNGLGGGEYGTPAWFNGTVYYGAAGDVIRAFPVSAGLLSTSPSSTTQNSFPYPGATPAISASGTSNAILWAVENSDPAVLHAYDANDLTVELYNSSQTAEGQDQFGAGNKFITPTIANGKVFVGTTNGVAVFGLPEAPQLGPLLFVPVTPCRVADTRNPGGPFGGPGMEAGGTRAFAISNSGCGIPVTAAAYSMNLTVIPDGQLTYLTLWQAGQPQPATSTLNSDGRIKAGSAIVPAGVNGAVNVYVTDPTQLIIDVNGYFVPAGSAPGLAFYPVTPCRAVDTRQGNDALSGPFLSGGTSRDFPILASSCGIPSNAQAYSVTLTAVPHSALAYLTTWATGQAQPFVSTLNALGGIVTANAAIVQAGYGGSISVAATDDTDLMIDIDGYFAAPSAGGLSFYTVMPCRALDTRNPPGSQPFSGAIAVNVLGSGCGASADAQAYVLNATAVPPGALTYLTWWPDGQPQPFVSTLNAPDGAIASDMTITSTMNGFIDFFASDPTHLVLDLSGYFAP